MWDCVASALAERFRVVRYDMRGFGRSAMPAEPFSGYGELRALLDHVAIRRASLVGVSLSGAIAVESALVHPEMVDALVAVRAPEVQHVLDAADHLARIIPGARQATVEGGAHTVAMEQSEAFARIMFGFLRDL